MVNEVPTPARTILDPAAEAGATDNQDGTLSYATCLM
jgi:hypothetical protein